MNKYLLIPAVIFLMSHTCSAQISDLLKRKAGEGVKQATQNVTEHAADKVLDKFINRIGKKTKTEETVAMNNKTAPQNATEQQVQPSVKTYSKYDFIPGEKILGYDDYSGDAIGDFPAKWSTNSSGEIMTADKYPGNWLNISKEGYYLPEFIQSLSENFTIEYDILFIPPSKRDGPNTATVGLQMINKTGKSGFENGPDRSYFELDPYLGKINVATYTKTGETLLSNSFSINGLDRNKIFTYHIAIWRQKNRLRVYLDENKVLDIPSLLSEDIKYNTIRYATSLNNDGSNWLISNFKLASGLPDVRNKLITEGKFSTTGILFSPNSSSIEPQSYGTVKDIASVLKENSTIKIMIVGHTDSDGSDAANLELSKNRAEAVKAMLSKEFGISESLIQTDGKGETQPAVPNTSSEGKAQNRRVEFIKM